MDYRKKRRSPQVQRRPIVSPPSKQMSRLEAIRGRMPRNVPITTGRSGRESSRPTERNTDDVPRKRKATPIRRESSDTQLEPVKKQSKPVERNTKRESPMKRDRNDDSRDDSNADANEPSSKIRIRGSSQSKYNNLPPCKC